jgi:hypothetical protein
MSAEPLISQEIQPANAFLWVVKTYLDLISRDDRLVYGSGLKRLCALQSGLDSLNDDDIEAVVAKAEKLNLIPNNLNGFLESAVLKNIELYGRELNTIIQERIIAIGNGDVRNPDPLLKFSSDEARRYYYTPPVTFLQRLQRALNQDTGGLTSSDNGSVAVSIQDVANDADILLTRMQIEQGHLTQVESAWGAVSACATRLVSVLENESAYPVLGRDYRVRARGALKILWFIAKVLMGDLTITPLPKDINLVDLQMVLKISDGTLAAIPLPVASTIGVFCDDDVHDVSMKGRMYLSAVSSAVFYKNNHGEH